MKTQAYILATIIVAAIAIPALSSFAQNAKALDVSCGDLKTLVLKFDKPVKNLNVTVCPNPGPPGPPGPRGADGANGRDGQNGKNGTNGINGTSLPQDVINNVNTLSQKAATLNQIIAAFENGTLGNGGAQIGCLQFPNGTSIGDCPSTGGNGTGTGTNNTGGGTGTNTTGNGTGTGGGGTNGTLPNGTIPVVNNSGGNVSGGGSSGNITNGTVVNQMIDGLVHMLHLG
jgi:hypothetical protein